jgi:hypothetical protein|nr:MAG TPA: hypothetical protein [Caudoviricetes sp.]
MNDLDKNQRLQIRHDLWVSELGQDIITSFKKSKEILLKEALTTSDPTLIAEKINEAKGVDLILNKILTEIQLAEKKEGKE